MIVIRLARVGKCKRPFYRVVVADVRSPRDGKFIERVGHYNPIANKQGDQDIKILLDRVDHWVGQGAKMTDRVKHLVKFSRKTQTDTAPAA